jgi:hypothetical protein
LTANLRIRLWTLVALGLFAAPSTGWPEKSHCIFLDQENQRLSEKTKDAGEQLALLQQKLVTAETSCEKLQKRVASNHSSGAIGEGCQALAEASSMELSLAKISEKCSADVKELSQSVDNLVYRFMEPYSRTLEYFGKVDQLIRETMKGCERQSEEQKNIRESTSTLYKSAQEVSSRARSHVATYTELQKQFVEIGEATGLAAEKCKRSESLPGGGDAGSPVAIGANSRVLGNGGPDRSPASISGSHSKPVSSISGIEDDSKKRMRESEMLKKP